MRAFFFLLSVINLEMQIALEEEGLLVLNIDANITGPWLRQSGSLEALTQRLGRMLWGIQCCAKQKKGLCKAPTCFRCRNNGRGPLRVHRLWTRGAEKGKDSA